MLIVEEHAMLGLDPLYVVRVSLADARRAQAIAKAICADSSIYLDYPLADHHIFSFPLKDEADRFAKLASR